jgi:hypothetical protein
MTTVPDILLQLNIDIDLLIILLYLPVVTTLIGLARYIFGIKTMGIYAPILMTFMFFELGFNNELFTSSPVEAFKLGLPLVAIVIFVSIMSYRILRPYSMHYYSKLAIVITTVALSLVTVMFMAEYLGYVGFLGINIFSLILIATLAERYMNLVAFSKSNKKALMLSLETVLLSSACYLIISINFLQEILLNYPIVILLLFPINYLIGRYTGLRLTEYYRFRAVLNNEEEEE